MSGRSVAPALETPPEEWASSHGLAHVPWLRDGQGTVKEEHLGVVSWDLEITVEPMRSVCKVFPITANLVHPDPHRAPAYKGFLKL